MPIEYEMKYFYDHTVKAIADYSKVVNSAFCVGTVEDYILRSVVNNDKTVITFFTSQQMSSMKELINRNVWLKWCYFSNRYVLSRDPIAALILWDDSLPIPSGAD